MLKRVLLVILLLLAVGGGVAYYMGFFEKESPKQVSPAIDAVPANAAFIIEWKSLDAFRELSSSGNKLVGSLRVSGLLEEQFRSFSFIDSLITSDSLLSHTVGRSPVFVSAHLSGVKKFNFLFTTNIPANTDSSDIEDFVKKKFPGHQLVSRRYENSTIYELKKNDVSLFAYTIINSVLVCSHSTVLTEEGIRHIRHGKSLRDDMNFRKVMETSKGRESGTVYINYKILPSFAELFLKPDPSKEFRLVSHFANWSASDIKVKDDAVLLSGYVYTNDTNNNYLNIFRNIKPQQAGFQELIPSNVSYCHWLGIADFKAYFRNYYSWLENGNRYFQVQNDIKAINQEHKIKFPDDLSGFAVREAFSFVTEVSAGDTISTGKYFAFEVKEPEKAISYFEQLRPASETDTLTVTSSEIQVKAVYLKDLFRLTGLSPFRIECNFMAIIADHLVFAPTRQDLLKLISAVQNGNTLKKSAVFADLNEYLGNEASIYTFAVPFRARKIVPEIFDFKEENRFSAFSKYMSDHSVLAYQVSSGKDLFYQDILLKFNPEAAKEQIPVWEAEAEEPLNFVQEITAGDFKGVAVTDEKNTLHLFDDAGGLRFSRQLTGPVKEKITILPTRDQVPVLLVPSSAELLAININGLIQEGFPLKVRLSYAAVFDYEDKKDPRIIAGTENGKIHCYTGSGKPVTTFDAADVKEPLTSAPLFMRTGNKDHLVFVTSNSIIFTDRKGKTLYRENVRAVPGTAKPVKKGNSVMLGYIGEDSNIHLLSPEKKSSSTLQQTASLNFYYEDVNKDRKKEYIICDTSGVKVVNDSFLVMKEIPVSGLRSIELKKGAGSYYLPYNTVAEKGIIDLTGYPVAGLPQQADGLSVRASSEPLEYYIIRGRKIYKFVNTGH